MRVGAPYEETGRAGCNTRHPDSYFAFSGYFTVESPSSELLSTSDEVGRRLTVGTRYRGAAAFTAYISRTLTLFTLPTSVCGKESTNSTVLGTLYADSFSLQ